MNGVVGQTCDFKASNGEREQYVSGLLALINHYDWVVIYPRAIA
ncbi:hypothetical protein [Thiofilum flexile]|nr:hypothetical protein [Thiofilum flexile]